MALVFKILIDGLAERVREELRAAWVQVDIGGDVVDGAFVDNYLGVGFLAVIEDVRGGLELNQRHIITL